MKKLHIFLLVAVAAAIAIMISFMTNLTTYNTVASAKEKLNQDLTLIAKLDRTQPIEYDALANPNYCSFTIIDSLGFRSRVISNKPKPAELEQSERIVLKGKMQADGFHCNDILLKCPSKYKDDMDAARKQLEKKS